MDLKEIGINSRNWVDSAQDRDYWRALVNATLNLQFPEVMELVSQLELHLYVTQQYKLIGSGSIATKKIFVIKYLFLPFFITLKPLVSFGFLTYRFQTSLCYHFFQTSNTHSSHPEPIFLGHLFFLSPIIPLINN